MKTLAKLLAIVLISFSLIFAGFTRVDLVTSESEDQNACVHELSGEDFDKAVGMALSDEAVTRLSKFLQTLNYKPQASDDVAVRVTCSDNSGQHDVTAVGLAFKNNDDNARIVSVKNEGESGTIAFTFHKSDNGTIVTAYTVDQNGDVIPLADIWDCIGCAICFGAAIIIVLGCISACGPIVPCIIACCAAAGHPIAEPCVHVCIECWEHLKTVGGVVVPVDASALLAPYVGLASTIVVATAATTIHVKRVKRRKEKQ